MGRIMNYLNPFCTRSDCIWVCKLALTHYAYLLIDRVCIFMVGVFLDIVKFYLAFLKKVSFFIESAFESLMILPYFDGH